MRQSRREGFDYVRASEEVLQRHKLSAGAGTRPEKAHRSENMVIMCGPYVLKVRMCACMLMHVYVRVHGLFCACATSQAQRRRRHTPRESTPQRKHGDHVRAVRAQSKDVCLFSCILLCVLQRNAGVGTHHVRAKNKHTLALTMYMHVVYVVYARCVRLCVRAFARVCQYIPHMHLSRQYNLLSFLSNYTSTVLLVGCRCRKELREGGGCVRTSRDTQRSHTESTRLRTRAMAFAACTGTVHTTALCACARIGRR